LWKASFTSRRHLPYLRRLIDGLGLLDLLAELGLTLATFPDLGLDRH